MVGTTQFYGAGFGDIWLIRIDASGDTLWTRTYGGVEYDDGKFVQQTTDNGFIVVGSTQSYGAGSRDVWLIRTDLTGDTVWTQTYGGTEAEDGWSVDVTSDGGYIVTGVTHEEGHSNLLLVRLGPDIVGVEEESDAVPQNFTLYQNHPNPFNPVTTIRYSLPQSGDVSLIIYNLLGEEIVRLIDGEQSAGYHTVTWDASKMASGVYLYRLQAGDFVRTRKMVLLK